MRLKNYNMYYDYINASKKQEAKEKYEKLKEFIVNSPEWYIAIDHINDMEHKLEKQKEQLKKYQDFLIL